MNELPYNATHAQIVELVREAITEAYGWMPDDPEATLLATNVADSADALVAGTGRRPGAVINLMLGGDAARGIDLAAGAFSRAEAAGHEPMTPGQVADMLRAFARALRTGEVPSSLPRLERSTSVDHG